MIVCLLSSNKDYTYKYEYHPYPRTRYLIYTGNQPFTTLSSLFPFPPGRPHSILHLLPQKDVCRLNSSFRGAGEYRSESTPGYGSPCRSNGKRRSSAIWMSERSSKLLSFKERDRVSKKRGNIHPQRVAPGLQTH